MPKRLLQAEWQNEWQKLKRTIIFMPLALLLLGAFGEAAGQRQWLGPDGTPLPFGSDAEILDFLKTASVVSVEEVGQGITNPYKILLEQGSIRMHAIFRYGRSLKQESRSRGAVRWNFRDDYIFECAAYHLSLLLGLDNVPPVVLRTIKGRKGSLQIWIEKAFTEEERRDRGLTPPDPVRWTHQRQIQRLFDQLINNEDRNLGNTLIDSDWKLWLIDHSRAFHPISQLWDPDRIVTCERSLWDRLRNLDREEVRRRLDPFLRSNELSTLFKRWDQLVDRISRLIEERGEEFVVFEIKNKEAGGRRQEERDWRRDTFGGSICGLHGRWSKVQGSGEGSGFRKIQQSPGFRSRTLLPASCLLPPASFCATDQ